MMRDWAIRSIVDGKESDRIIECKTQAEARDWVTRFPLSYRLLSRFSAGEWTPENTTPRADETQRDAMQNESVEGEGQ